MPATLRVLADGSLTAAGAKLSYDAAGFPSFRQHPDDTDLLTIDWTGLLGAETISSAVWVADGLTLTSNTISGKQTSVKVSAVPECSHGTAEVTLTTSGGRIKTLAVRFYGREPA